MPPKKNEGIFFDYILLELRQLCTQDSVKINEDEFIQLGFNLKEI